MAKKPKAHIAGTYLTVSPAMLRPNPANYNRESPFVFSKLVDSIRTFGFTDPVVVRELPGDDGTTYEIIGGEHRWKAAQKLAMPEIPILNLGEVTDTAARQMLIALNETKGTADEDALSSLIRRINEEGGDEAIQVLPYTEAELANFLDGEHPDIHDDDDAGTAPVVEDNRPTKIKPGDVALTLELEGASQKELKRLMETIRKWRNTKSDDAPCHVHLRNLLKSDMAGAEGSES